MPNGKRPTGKGKSVPRFVSSSHKESELVETLLFHSQPLQPPQSHHPDDSSLLALSHALAASSYFITYMYTNSPHDLSEIF